MNIPLNASTFGDEEIEAAIKVLRSGQVTMGKFCHDFEDAFAHQLNVKNAVFVNSGSSANLLAFFSLANSASVLPKGLKRLTPGAEVLVPAVTWSTTVWPIVQAGGVPVLVDVDPQTLQIDLKALAHAVGPKCVGICPVHVLGNAVPWSPLEKIARENNLWIVEDTCEALGTRHNEQYCGTRGLMGTYSFFFSHHITTIEGGMIVTNNDDMAEMLRCQRAHGWTRHLKNRASVEAKYPEIDPRFLFINTGFNVRPTELNAAFGLHQLKKLQRFNERRQEIAQQWITELQPLIEKGLFAPMQTTPATESTWFGFPVMCNSSKTRDELKNHLERNGVETRPIICGNLARQPAFKLIPHRIAGDLEGANQVMDRGLFWGSHPLMSDAEVEYVTKVVKQCFV